MSYFGGSSFELGGCACAENEFCADGRKLECACDANDDLMRWTWQVVTLMTSWAWLFLFLCREDFGFLLNKTHLPVSGFSTPSASGEFSIGALQCAPYQFGLFVINISKEYKRNTRRIDFFQEFFQRASITRTPDMIGRTHTSSIQMEWISDSVRTHIHAMDFQAKEIVWNFNLIPDKTNKAPFPVYCDLSAKQGGCAIVLDDNSTEVCVLKMNRVFNSFTILLIFNP